MSSKIAQRCLCIQILRSNGAIRIDTCFGNQTPGSSRDLQKNKNCPRSSNMFKNCYVNILDLKIRRDFRRIIGKQTS
jgi:hypothetical protein